jgi:hypothetical protein
MMILIAACVAGCAHPSDCDWASPIRPAPEDDLTRGTVEQIVAHNETGQQLCGWTP